MILSIQLLKKVIQEIQDHIAKKGAKYLKSSGLGDTAYFGPEAEFFIFNDVKYDSGSNFAFHEVDSN